MRRRMTLHRFALKVGFKRADSKGLKSSLRHLQKTGALIVKQGGYLGHSMCHPKIVIVYDWPTVKMHFGIDQPAKKPDVEYEYEEEEERQHSYRRYYRRPKREHVPRHCEIISSVYLLCVSNGKCQEQFILEGLPYPLCRAPRICKEQVGSALKQKTILEIKQYFKPQLIIKKRKVSFGPVYVK